MGVYYYYYYSIYENFKISKIFNLYVWMVLGYDTWHNQNVPCDILINFSQIEFRWVSM